MTSARTGRTLVAVAVILGFIILFPSCGKQEKSLSTGTVVEPAGLPIKGFNGDDAYAVVQSSALPALYDNFRSVLSKQGLVKVDERFDCNHFASLYIALSQSRFTVAAWHSGTKAQTLALAEVWYRPAGSVGGHAVVAVVTERGMLFVEPQTGREFQLTPVELRSIYLCKW